MFRRQYIGHFFLTVADTCVYMCRLQAICIVNGRIQSQIVVENLPPVASCNPHSAHDGFREVTFGFLLLLTCVNNRKWTLPSYSSCQFSTANFFASNFSVTYWYRTNRSHAVSFKWILWKLENMALFLVYELLTCFTEFVLDNVYRREHVLRKCRNLMSAQLLR